MADTATTGVAAAAQINEPLIRVEGLRKSFGSLEVLKGTLMAMDERGRHHHWRLGLGQVDFPALPQPARDPGRGPHLVPWPGPHGRALQHQQAARGHRHGVPGL